MVLDDFYSIVDMLFMSPFLVVKKSENEFDLMHKI